MPNWCDNTLKLSHDDPVVWEAFVKKMNDAEPDENGNRSFFNVIRPMPKELLDINDFDGGWYAWRRVNWGTKWDVDVNQEDNESGEWSFQSAWCPPMMIYNYLTEQGFNVEAWYYEPGCELVGCYEDGMYDDYQQGDPNAEHVFEELGYYEGTEWLEWLHGGDYDEEEHVEAEEAAEEAQAQALKAMDAAVKRALAACHSDE